MSVLNQLLLKMLMILRVGDGIDYLCKALWRQSSLHKELYGTYVSIGVIFCRWFLIYKLAQGTSALQLDHKLSFGKETTVSAGFRRAALLLSLSVIPDRCSQRGDAGGQEG